MIKNVLATEIQERYSNVKKDINDLFFVVLVMIKERNRADAESIDTLATRQTNNISDKKVKDEVRENQRKYHCNYNRRL